MAYIEIKKSKATQFMSECILDPENLKEFITLVKGLDVMFPFLGEMLRKDNVESATWEVTKHAYCDSAKKLCSALSHILKEGMAQKLLEFMVAMTELPESPRKLAPRKGNTNAEVFNRQEFCLYVKMAVEHFSLFDGCQCCGRDMSMRSLGMLLVGYDHVESFDGNRSVFEENMPLRTAVNMVHRSDTNKQWQNRILEIAKPVFCPNQK